MGKYGQAAIEATRFLHSTEAQSPPQAWQKAVELMFPNSKSSRDKGCPKGAYLGLCEDGLVTGVPAGNYTRSVKNKLYAVEAVPLLRANPELAEDEWTLWLLVMRGEHKTQNSQMDVVCSLWKAGMIE